MDNSTDTPVPAGPLPGVILAAAREAQGLSIGDISQKLKLSVAQIRAIEADDHSKLPSPVFVRGFIRSYARLLKLDESHVLPPKVAVVVPVAIAPASITGYDSPPDVRMMQDAQRDAIEPSPYRRVPVLLAGIACVLLALAYYEFVMNAPPPPAPPAPSAAPTEAVDAQPAAATPVVPVVAMRDAAAPATAAAIETAKIERPESTEKLKLKKSADPVSGLTSGLHFVFNGESWVEVRDSDGKVVFSNTNLAGTERRVQGKPPLSVVVGGSSKVKLSFNGKPIELTSYANDDVARLRLE